MMEIITLDRAQKLADSLVRIRRTIHRHPELGFQEVRTAELVAEVLGSLGMSVEKAVARTGVVGQMGTGQPVVAIRAEMDALPIGELNQVPYASQVPGVMHACGHDAHVACVLGAAMLLSRQEQLPGQVRFLFQPSEETRDEDDRGGAELMVEAGAMEGVEAVFGLHASSSTPVGSVEVSPGPVMATANRFKGAVLGKSSHGAVPEEGIDAIHLAGQVITAANAIVSRRISPETSAVISLGTISGGTQFNVIADRVELSGTIRSYDEATFSILVQELERAFALSRTLGGDYEFWVDKGLPVVVNAPELAEVVEEVASDLLGREHVLPQRPRMVGEDFSILAKAAARGGAFIFLGVKGQVERPWHNPYFDIQEEAIPIGAAVLAETARRHLERKAGP